MDELEIRIYDTQKESPEKILSIIEKTLGHSENDENTPDYIVIALRARENQDMAKRWLHDFSSVIRNFEYLGQKTLANSANDDPLFKEKEIMIKNQLSVLRRIKEKILDTIFLLQ